MRLKAEPSSQTNAMSTPLHSAVQRGHTGVVQLLLNQGADVNSKNESGVTPLFHAVEAGMNEVRRALFHVQKLEQLLSFSQSISFHLFIYLSPSPPPSIPPAFYFYPLGPGHIGSFYLLLFS